MTGGLMNLTTYGKENLILNEIQKNIFQSYLYKNVLILDYKDLE